MLFWIKGSNGQEKGKHDLKTLQKLHIFNVSRHLLLYLHVVYLHFICMQMHYIYHMQSFVMTGDIIALDRCGVLLHRHSCNVTFYSDYTQTFLLIFQYYHQINSKYPDEDSRVLSWGKLVDSNNPTLKEL